MGLGKLGMLKKLWTNKSGDWGYEEPEYDPKYIVHGVRGLIGQYYLGKEFEYLKYQRVDSRIVFDWGKDSPHESLNNDLFSVRWRGLFNAPATGMYTFIVTSDDGVRLSIKQQILIDNWYPHAVLTESGSIFLDKGEHIILIEYFDQMLDAELKIEVEGPTIEKKILNHDLLTPLVY